MAINWNLAGYVSPNIEITPEQLPLEALVKTSDVLQDRYDKSKENYTKAQEYQRQMLSQANEADKEAAQQIFSQYENQLKDVADRGDYHNMRWETLNLAQEAANNYTAIAKKNELIEKRKEEIAKNPIYFKTRDRQMDYFLKNLPKLGYDPEKRVITGLNVPMHDAAADIEPLKLALNYGSVMKPTSTKGKDYDIIGLSPEGKEISRTQVNQVPGAILAKKTYSGKILKLTEKEIEEALDPALKEDTTIQAYLNREVQQLYNLDPESEEGKAVKQKIYKNDIIPSIHASAGLLRQYQDDRTADVTPWTNFNLGAGNGNVNQSGVYSPTDQYQPLGAEGRSEFPVMFNSALLGDKGAKVKLMSTLHAMAAKDPKAKEVVALTNDMFKFSQEYPEYASILNKSTAGRSDWFLASGAQDVMNVLDGLRIAAQGKGNPKVGNAVGKLIERYGKIANSGILDSDFEDQFEQFTTQKQQTRQTPTYSWSVTNPQSRELFNKLREDFTIDKFDIIEGKWEDGENRKLDALTNFTLEPYGGGLGITFEGRDSKGRSVRMVPKKQHETAILGEIAKLVPDSDVLNTNIYKGITPIAYPNIPVKLADLADEIEDSRFAATVKKSYGNNSIMLKDDGSYVMLDPNGKVINQNSSMYKLLPKFYGANNQTKKK
jgi:hypothetical protein